MNVNFAKYILREVLFKHNVVVQSILDYRYARECCAILWSR